MVQSLEYIGGPCAPFRAVYAIYYIVDGKEYSNPALPNTKKNSAHEYQVVNVYLYLHSRFCICLFI